MPKTQQVATACLALNQATLREKLDEHTGDQIFIGSTDGKEHTPRKVFLETSSAERLIEFKLLGVIKGSTPTAIAIAEIGKYKRKLMEETNYGVISKNWEKKLALCLEAQKKLLQLEEKELQVNFTDDSQRHQFMNEVKAILNSAINQNKIECSGITHREGRLESQFIKGIHELEENFERAFSQHVLSSGDQTQAVPAYFSPADQLQFDMKKPMAIDLTEHLSDTEACDFLEYYYNTRPNLQKNLQQITLTNDGFKRSGIFSKTKDSFFLAEKRPFLRRLSYNTKLSTKVIWSFLKQPVTDVRDYLKKQGKALSNSVFDALIEVHIKKMPSTETKPSSDHQTAIQDLSQKLDEALKQAPTKPAVTQTSATVLIDSAWVKPEHKIIVQDQYENFLAQVLYVLKNNLKKFDTLSKSHEVIALAISMGGAASLLVLFKAGLIHGALKSAIKSFFHANEMNPYEAVARPLHTMDYLSKLMTLGSDASGGNLESLVKKFEDPLRAAEILAATIAHAINIDLADHPGLESHAIEKAVLASETMAVRLDQVDTALSTQEPTVEQKEQAEMLDNIQLIQAQSLMLLAHNLENRKQEITDKKPLKVSFLGSAVLFALRPVFAIIKPVVAFSAAAVAAIQLKSPLPLRIAVYEWQNRLKQGAKKLGLMAIDFSDALSKGVYDLSAFCIRTPLKGTFTMIRKILGTTNDLLVGTSHLLGFKKVQETPLKSVIRGLVATEDFLVNKVGNLLRKTRHGIGKGFNVIRHWIAPNGPIERLELAAKTLQTCEQALRYQHALIQKNTALIHHDALCSLLLNKIQLITDLTGDVLAQTKQYQQALRNNNNPEDVKKHGEILKANLLKTLAEFDAKIAQHNLSLDLTRIASKQERMADTALEQRRNVLNDIIQQIPIAPTPKKTEAQINQVQQTLDLSPQTNALFEKESITAHLPKATPAIDQQAVLEALHAQFKQDIEQGSRRALR